MTKERLSAEKESLFGRYDRGEISFDDLSRRIYEIDHPSPNWLALLKAAYQLIGTGKTAE